MNNELNDIIIYASKENIEKIKANEENYFHMQKEHDNTINYYLKRIDELESKIDDYEITFDEYEDKISELNSQIAEYKSTIEAYENE